VAKSPSSSRSTNKLPNYWNLQNAKARFSELIRRVGNDGPQHVTVHGRDEVVVISVEEYRRLNGERTGQDLIRAFQLCPDQDLKIEPIIDSMVVSYPVKF
jgi:prevent-host-death family protein